MSDRVSMTGWLLKNPAAQKAVVGAMKPAKTSPRNPNTQKCPECGKMSLQRLTETGRILSDNLGGEFQEVNIYFECPCGYGESAQ